MSTDLRRVAADLAPSGVLRASINLGNPVLAQGSLSAPSGVTVDLAQEFAKRLGLGISLVCFDAARKSFKSLASGQADICFLAIEPAREKEIAFTAPYVLIDGVFVVAADSPFGTPAQLDRHEVRIGVSQGSAYDLFLSRTLRQASLARATDGVAEFYRLGLEAIAGIRKPLSELVAADPDLRLIDEPFMQIRQAVGTARTKARTTVRYLRDTVEELKSNGFVAASLARSQQLV